MTTRGAIGVFTTDRALVVRSWDAWLADASGVSESEASGQPLAALFPELEPRGLLARLRGSLETGAVELLAPAFHEYLIPCAPRVPSAHFARMQQAATITPLRADGVVVGLAVTIEDVTARRTRERELALQLKSTDDAVRLRAVRALAAESGVGAGALSDALGDRSWQVRRAASDALARTSDAGAPESLVAALRERHRDPSVLNAALSALVHTSHDVAPAIIELLERDDDVEVRTYAALALGLLEDRRAVPALVRALDDADPNARFHAIEALGRIRSRAAALAVSAVAETRDFSVAFAALDTLALIGEPSVAPRLVPLLDDELLQTAAAEALGQLGGHEVAAPLAELLVRSPSAAAAAAGALARLSERLGDSERDVADLVRSIATPEAAAHLAHAVDTASDEEVHGLVVVLGWLEWEGVEPALVQALGVPAARRAATEALVRRGARAVEPLLAALREHDDDVRTAAAATLGRLGPPAAVPALLALLADAPHLGVVTAGALGRIGDQRAFEPLLAQLDHPHASVRQAAVAALHSIAHPDSTARACALLEHPSPLVREGAASIVGYLGDASCLPLLLALCDDADDVVRRTVVEQLPHFDDPDALSAMAQALATGSSGVRAAAVRALAHVDEADALPQLLGACADGDPWVRYYAARALGHQASADAVPTLVRLATGDLAPPVRIAAIDALAEIRAAEGLAALRPVAGDPDPMVATQALLALGRSDDAGVLPALLAALPSSERTRRMAALDALALLARRSDAGVVAAVAPLARDGADPEVQSRAAAVLAEIGGEAAVAALVAAAEEPRHTAAVVDALARLPEDQVPWVSRGLAHRDPAVRSAIAEVLGRMRHASAAAPLARALEDRAAGVQLAAAHALGLIDLRAARAVGATPSAGAISSRSAGPE